MAKKGQHFRNHSDRFKLHVVYLRVKKGYSLSQISRMYDLSKENIVKWTYRFLNGEPLTMKRGRPKKSKENNSKSDETELSLEQQLEQLKTELAYKNKVIEYLEEREQLKKKKSSKSSEN